MKSAMDYIDDRIEEKLLHLHTSYLGTAVGINPDGTFDVQPLTLTKAIGGKSKQQSVVKNVYCLDDVAINVRTGDVVVCLVCERDISEAVLGNSTLPSVGHHQMKDSIIIGTIGSLGAIHDSALIADNKAEQEEGGSDPETPIPVVGGMTAKQKKCVEWAMSQVGKAGFNSYRNGYCNSTNWCARFVSSAYAFATGTYPGGNAIDFPHSHPINLNDTSNIPIGACIVSKGYPVGGIYYGHVALYVGKGYVVEAGGAKIRYSPLAQSIGRKCGFYGWGMPVNLN